MMSLIKVPFSINSLVRIMWIMYKHAYVIMYLIISRREEGSQQRLSRHQCTVIVSATYIHLTEKNSNATYMYKHQKQQH